MILIFFPADWDAARATEYLWTHSMAGVGWMFFHQPGGIKGGIQAGVWV